MKVQPIVTLDDFQAFVERVKERPGQKLPIAYAIGAVGLAGPGYVTEAHFPRVNASGTGPAAAAAFAVIAGYVSGNAVYHMKSSDFIELEAVFTPFMVDPENHPNVAAFLKVKELVAEQHHLTPVIVFVGDFDNDQCRGRPIYEEFMKALCLSRAT